MTVTKSSRDPQIYLDVFLMVPDSSSSDVSWKLQAPSSPEFLGWVELSGSLKCNISPLRSFICSFKKNPLLIWIYKGEGAVNVIITSII